MIHYSKNTIPKAEPFVSGEGAVLVGRDGGKYIDLSAQTLNANLGQCHPLIVEAVTRQLQRLTYTSSRYSSDVAEKLVNTLVEITPKKFHKVNLKCVSGSDANECALKIVRKKTGKYHVISLLHSHHGQTVETMRISGKNFGTTFLGERSSTYIHPPYCYRCPVGKHPDTCSVECLSDMEKLIEIRKDDFAAVFVEPIMVDAGVLAPPRKYHVQRRQVCNQYKIPLVYDEVQTAFGWLGTIFAMDYYNVQPDIVTLAKGLGAGFPIGAVVFPTKFDVLEYGEHEITYGAHPVSCAAAIAMIVFLRTGGLEQVIAKSVLVDERFYRIVERHRLIGDVRGVGLLRGIEVVNPADNNPDSKTAKRLYEEMLCRGFILRISKVGQHSNVLQFKPPLVITEEQLHAFFDNFEQLLSEIERLP